MRIAHMPARLQKNCKYWSDLALKIYNTLLVLPVKLPSDWEINLIVNFYALLSKNRLHMHFWGKNS